MNTTGLVGYIALLMILGASLGGKNSGYFGPGLRADALNYATLSEHMGNGILDSNSPRENTTQTLMSRATLSPLELTEKSQYVRVYIQGIPYEGTIYPVKGSFSQ